MNNKTDKIPPCLEYQKLLEEYAYRNNINVQQARNVCGQWTYQDWQTAGFNMFTNRPSEFYLGKIEDELQE